MLLEVIRILFDFGLVVFFWMLQLVVYPSWQHFQDEALIHWYHTGKGKIWYLGLFLGPGQLFFSGIQLLWAPSTYTALTFAIIMFLWGYSFTVMSSVHNQIMGGTDTSEEHRGKLLKYNWVRVVGCSFIFIWSFVQLSSRLSFFGDPG